MSRFFISLLLILLLSVSATSQTDLSQLRFVFSGPFESGPPSTRHTVRVYEYVDSTNTLDKVWEKPQRGFVCYVGVLGQEAVVYVELSKGQYGSMSDLVLCSEERQGKYDEVSIEDVAGYWLFGFEATDEGPRNLLMANGLPPDSGPLVRFDLRSGEKTADRSAVALANLRLAGARPAHYGMSSNIMSVKIRNGYVVFPEYLVVPQVLDVQIDDSLSSDRYWRMFANSAAKSYFYRLADEPSDSTTTVLIIDRADSTYEVVEVPGPRSYVRYYGGWLGGIIRDFHPEYDFKRRFGKHSVQRSSAFILNDKTLELSVIELGESATLLWVDDTRVLYRIQNELYEATHSEGKVTGTRLLVRDSDVYMLHWVYLDRGE